MKHQALRIAASCLNILTWVVLAVGVIVSIIIGIGASTLVAKIGFLLGGLVCTAIMGLTLFVSAKLIYLLIEIEEDLSQIADNTKQK